LGVGFLENVANAGDLVGAQVVHDDDVAGPQRRRQAMAEIGKERRAIHRPIDHPERVDPITP
jgi:hypothetical protein